MKTRITVILLLIGLVVFTGCSSAKRAGVTHVFQPSWYDLQDNSDFVYTYGHSEKVSHNAAEQAAYALAMQSAAQYVEAHVQSMIKNFIQESGTDNPQVLAMTSGVQRVVSNAKFNGTQIAKRETVKLENGRFQTFVRVSIPKMNFIPFSNFS